MSLAQKLDEIRAMAKSRIPPDALNLMHGATNALRESGIMRGVIKVGQRLPAFNLQNAREEWVSSQALLARGPLVLTIFRGHW